MNTAAFKNVTKTVEAKWWSDTRRACRNSGKPGAGRGRLGSWEGRREGGKESSQLQPPCCMCYRQDGGPLFFNDPTVNSGSWQGASQIFLGAPGGGVTEESREVRRERRRK